MLRNLRVLLAALALAALPAIPVLWPPGWPDSTQLLAVVPLSLLGVLLIEMERRSRPGAEQGGGEAEQPGGEAGRERRSAGSERTTDPPEQPPEIDPFPPQETFRGRESDLGTLVRRYEAARQRNVEARSGRPVLLLIHGKPGVGKTALALELARRLARWHPDGGYHINLAEAGDRLTAAEALSKLLVQQQWPEPLHPDPGERVKVFRALTADKRLLFVFDAARDHLQVLALIPTGEECTVIVTSRRDLSSGLRAASWHLDEPGADDALDILHAAAETSDDVDPEGAATIVELCGRLPLAIMSAAERIALERAEIGSVANALGPESTRLERLSRHGRSVERRIRGQYDQLEDPLEQQAFRLLALVPAPTFVSWVLGPLLDCPIGMAESLMARLADAQLLDTSASDRASGLPRYRMHPLVRLFAEKLLRRDGLPHSTPEEAQRRLWLAYRWVLAEVLGHLDPDFRLRTPVPTPPGLRAGEPMAAHVANDPQQWIRTEFPLLTECVHAAFDDGEWRLCWRVAAWLGEGFPAPGDIARTLAAFDKAARAADEDGSRAGRIDVLLAKASVLTAAERYAEADDVLKSVQRETAEWMNDYPDQADEALFRKGRAHLVAGEGWLQMRRPPEAESDLQEAMRIFGAGNHQGDLALARILAWLNNDLDPDVRDDDLRAIRSDRRRFWAMLALAERCRRRRDWQPAAEYLKLALGCCEGDSRRVANVRYREARLHLERFTLEGGDLALARRAVRRAADAVVAFRHMEDRAGEIRARCLLVRALAAAGRDTLAQEQLVTAERLLSTLSATYPGAALLQPLRGRLEWARGVMLASSAPDQSGRAHGALVKALAIFADLKDERPRAAVKRAIDSL